MKQSGASTTFFLKFHKYMDRRTEFYNVKSLSCGEREGRKGTEGDIEREGCVHRDAKDRLKFRSRLDIDMIEFSVRPMRQRLFFFFFFLTVAAVQSLEQTAVDSAGTGESLRVPPCWTLRT